MKGKIYSTVLLLGIVLPDIVQADTLSTTNKPNILIFIADDLGWEEVGAYGHQVVKTPNIDCCSKRSPF